jgi:hypothetical protein
MISWIITLGLLAVLGWYAYHVVISYKVATGSTWERVRAGAMDSATVLWGNLLWVSGAILDLADKAATVLNMPEVSDFIKSNLPPQYVAYGLIAIGVITVVARLRSL